MVEHCTCVVYIYVPVHTCIYREEEEGEEGGARRERREVQGGRGGRSREVDTRGERKKD